MELKTLSDSPKEMYRLVRDSLTTGSALELLLFLLCNSNQTWKPEDIVTKMWPTVITISAVKEYLSLFQANGIVSKTQDSTFIYDPSTPELREAINTMAVFYAERPVTVLRLISAPPESRIKLFADAFKLKED
jgi:hypothetical protein